MKMRNPRYDNLYVYKFDLQKLRSGDVILTRNAETESKKGRFQAAAITKFTGGNFSHALLCTVPPTLIEAIGEGVSNITVQICFVHDLANIKVLRYSDQKIARAAGSSALTFIGKGYSVRQAIRSILPNDPISQPQSDETFCSALVASAFKAAGAPEFANIDAMKTTPANLELADHFIDVTQDVFVKILSPNNIEEMSALDGDRVRSPLSGQASLFNSYYKTLIPLIQNFVRENPNLTITQIPASFLDCLGFILGTYAASAKLPLGTETDATRQNIKAIDKAAYNLLSSGEYRDMLKEADRYEQEAHVYTISESFKSKPDIKLTELEGLIYATKQQIEARSSSLDDDIKGISLAWDEWQSIARDIVKVLETRLLVLEEVQQRVFPKFR